MNSFSATVWAFLQRVIIAFLVYFLVYIKTTDHLDLNIHQNPADLDLHGVFKKE